MRAGASSDPSWNGIWGLRCREGSSMVPQSTKRGLRRKGPREKTERVDSALQFAGCSQPFRSRIPCQHSPLGRLLPVGTGRTTGLSRGPETMSSCQFHLQVRVTRSGACSLCDVTVAQALLSHDVTWCPPWPPCRPPWWQPAVLLQAVLH